jgi:Protein of unknown function (DUF1194)
MAELLALIFVTMTLIFQWTLHVQGQRKIEVDVELVLAVDASASMDSEEESVQRNGYKNALQQEEILRAIRSGLYGRIAATYVEWGEPGGERVVVPWTIIAGARDAADFSERIGRYPPLKPERTSISSGLLFAAGQFDTSPAHSHRRVIDVSGDGPNNIGPPVDATRDQVVREGIVINGLAITTNGGEGFGWQPWRPRDPDILPTYYRACVIGGPGSFVVSVDTTENLEAAIRHKLVLEISGVPPRLTRAAEKQGSRSVDCQIGEKNLNPPDPGHPRPFQSTESPR